MESLNNFTSETTWPGFTSFCMVHFGNGSLTLCLPVSVAQLDVDASGDQKVVNSTCLGQQNVSIGTKCQFVCVEVLRPSQPNGVMSSAVSLPNHTFYWAGLVL